MPDVFTIVKRVQVELEDVGVAWTDQDYIIRRLSAVNEDVCTRLESEDLAFDISVVVLQAVAANTPDLSKFQISGSPLYGLVIPRSIEWRLVGQNDEQYTPIPRVDKVIDTSIASNNQAVTSNQVGIASFEIRQGVVVISPSSAPTDIRVRGEFLPPLLLNDSDQQIIGLTNPLVYGVCQRICESRAEMSNLATVFKEHYERALDNFEVIQIKELQTRPMRLGGRRSAMNSSGGGLRPPMI